MSAICALFVLEMKERRELSDMRCELQSKLTIRSLSKLKMVTVLSKEPEARRLPSQFHPTEWTFENTWQRKIKLNEKDAINQKYL